MGPLLYRDERLEELCGGPERCQELLAQSYPDVLPEFHELTTTLTCPLTFARLALGMISPIVYQGCSFAVKDVDHERLHVELRLREHARPSLTFFRATVGELQALPRHLGLGPAAVTAEYGPTSGDYEVRLPPPRPASARRLGAPPSIERSARIDVEAHLSTVQVAWGLTSRQSEVLAHVIQGAANKEIAEQLECAENTVELHVTKLLQKTGVPSRARLIALFWAGFYEHLPRVR